LPSTKLPSNIQQIAQNMNTHQNHLKLMLICVAAAIPMVVNAQVSGYSAQNFNTNDGYVRGVGITSASQPASLRWEGNDPFNAGTGFGETDLVTRLSGYSTPPVADSSVLQGGTFADEGFLPGTNNVKIWKTFNAYSNNSSVSWLADWAIINSTNSVRDSFGFDLRGSNNTTSLLRLNFLPNSSSNYTLQVIGSTSQIWGTLGYDAIFKAQVDITGSAYSLSFSQVDENRNPIISYTNALSGALFSGSAASFDTIGVDWVLVSGDNNAPGSNYIAVNDLQVVPEPSTVALLSLAGLAIGFLYRRRRA
jgi:hypothetical protein